MSPEDLFLVYMQTPTWIWESWAKIRNFYELEFLAFMYMLAGSSTYEEER